MRRMKRSETHPARPSCLGASRAHVRTYVPAALVAAIFLVAMLPAVAKAQQKGQKTFASAEEATKAFYAAAKANDEKALLEILGPDGKDIVTSGDQVEDAHNHANFARRYDQMHRLVKEPNGETIIYVGAENWPAPIPLANKGNVWFFDTRAGRMEILYRRVGRNEMSAISVCEHLAAAEKEYFAEQKVYAGKIFSADGQHDGLYWKASAGETQSPIGPLVAEAVAEGYSPGHSGPPTPFRGYFFHVLTGQGKSAPGGAKGYDAAGKMTEGAAFVAYPAEYRSSGVMTFIVGLDGVVYERDLGKKTATVANAMKEFNPDSKWKKAMAEPEQTAAERKP